MAKKKINSIKTESSLGVREYSPSKTFYTGSKTEAEEQREKEHAEYVADLKARLKVFKPKSVLPIYNGRYSDLVKLVDPEKVIWEWNDEVINDYYFINLRDIVVMLENALELRK